MRTLTLLLLALLASLSAVPAEAQVTLSVTNEAITGTTIGKLAKYTATSPVTAVIATTSDTDGVVGIVAGFSLQGSTGITGNAYISQVGVTNCTFDTSGVTTKHYVIASTAAGGSCADGGATRPTGVQVIGVAQATGGSGASVAVQMDRGFANTAGSGSPANPTATIATSAVNGVAATFMRSDAAPAAPQCSASTFGLCKPDGTTITASGGVITSVGGAATTITPGTTTVVGATAPCLIDNSATTVMGCAAVGTGVLTAVANNLSANGGLAKTVFSGAKALATGAISSATCTSAQTDTATGTLTTDVVTASFNGDPTAVTGYVPLTAGMLTIIVYPTADTVNFKVCNNTSGSITPGAITLNWRVAR